MDIKHIKKSKLISIIITFVLLVGLTIGVVNMTGNKAQATASISTSTQHRTPLLPRPPASHTAEAVVPGSLLPVRENSPARTSSSTVRPTG